ncbi:sushi, nidogen and EGF-like domain-containing protein 1 [Oscarella lobularis]|uniref:sushi, nidogen and EGF-like domain-containing protein 1 n=1 Tax=Oscarella lobularis TaxID=121494 RepID=UPI0033139E6D
MPEGHEAATSPQRNYIHLIRLFSDLQILTRTFIRLARVKATFECQVLMTMHLLLACIIRRTAHKLYSKVFPHSDLPSIVAPFWADVDTRRGGNVFYQTYSNVSSEILQRANNDVKKFTSTPFTATWGFVPTWDRVTSFSFSSSLRNTFQVVIFSDERTTYSLFNYSTADQLQWASRVSIRYVASDLSTFENPLSGTGSVLSVARTSNFGVRGRYLYRITATVGCNDECASLRCENGGTCTDLFRDSTCACPPDFSGIRCQIAKPRCSSRIDNCTDFIKCAKRVLPCVT